MSRQKFLLAGFGLILVVAGISACSSNSSPTSTNSNSPKALAYGAPTSFGSSGGTTMKGPMGVAVAGTTVWVASQSTNSLQAWTPAGSYLSSVTSYNSTNFINPAPVYVGPDGYVYVGDGSYQVIELSPSGAFVTFFGNTQLGSAFPDGVAVNSNYAYVAAFSGSAVYKYSISGSGSSKTFTYQTNLTASAPNTLTNGSEGVGLDASGNVYVSDWGAHRVMEFNASGVYQSSITLASSGTPSGVVVDGSGNIIVSDNNNHLIQVFSSSGAPVTQFQSGTGGSLDPRGVALDSSQNLYVVDYFANQVFAFQRQ